MELIFIGAVALAALVVVVLFGSTLKWILIAAAVIVVFGVIYSIFRPQTRSRTRCRSNGSGGSFFEDVGDILDDIGDAD